MKGILARKEKRLGDWCSVLLKCMGPKQGRCLSWQLSDTDRHDSGGRKETR